MPYPWTDKIAEANGSITLGLRPLDGATALTDFPAQSIGASGEESQYGFAIHSAWWTSPGDTSLGESNPPEAVFTQASQTGTGSPGTASNRNKTWGVTPDDPNNTASLGTLINTTIVGGEFFTSYGGRISDTSSGALTFGLENYFYWREDYPGHTGGVQSTVSMPDFTRIVLDWGNGATTRIQTYPMGSVQCPTGAVSGAKAIHIEQQTNSEDLQGFNARIIGWILGPNYVDGETLTTGMKSVNVVESDDDVYTFWNRGPFGDTQLSDTDDTLAHSYFHLANRDAYGDGIGYLDRIVYCNWRPTPLYTAIGVSGPSDCEIFLPKWRDLPGREGELSEFVFGLDYQINVNRGTNRGWIADYYPENPDAIWPPPYHMILSEKDMSTWTELILGANDSSVCPYLNTGNSPTVTYDENGRWLLYWSESTAYPTLDDANNNTNGVVLPEKWFYADESEGWLGYECPLDSENGGLGIDDEEEDLPGTGPLFLNAWGFSLDGHDFYVVRLGQDSTVVYDLTTGQWADWASPDSANWRASVGINWLGMSADSLTTDAETSIVAGDDTLGVLWTLDPSIGYDEDPTTTDPVDFERKVIGGIVMRLRESQKVGAAYLSMDLGDPQMADATIKLETSDDFGHTWTDHGSITVTPDDFNQEIVWRALGLIKAPGRIFRITDNGASVRIDSLDIR